MVRVLLFLSLIIEGISFSVYNRLLFKSGKKFNYLLLIYSISYLTVFAVHGFSTYSSIVINIAIFLFANAFIFVHLYKLRIISALLRAFLLSGFSMISEVIVGAIKNHMTNNYWEHWNDAANLCFLSISSILYSAFVIGSAVIEKNIKKIRKSEVIIIPISFLSLAVFIVILINYFNLYFHYSLSFLSILNISVLIALLFSIIFVYIYMHQVGIAMSQQKQMLQAERDYTEFADEIRERDLEKRVLLHDIKNHLISIKNLFDKGDEKEFKDYIERLVSSSILQPSKRYCENELINSIVNRYQKEAEKENIEFIVESNSVELSFISSYDLTVILCNLLENAIEAATQVNGSFVRLTLSSDEEKQLSMITVVNSSPRIVKFVNGEPVTSKKDKNNHGLGIKSIMQAISNYEGLINMYQDENMNFHTVLVFSRGEK